MDPRASQRIKLTPVARQLKKRAASDIDEDGLHSSTSTRPEVLTSPMNGLTLGVVEETDSPPSSPPLFSSSVTKTGDEIELLRDKDIQKHTVADEQAVANTAGWKKPPVLGRTTVNVVVGQDTASVQHFHVHDELLSHRSPVLARSTESLEKKEWPAEFEPGILWEPISRSVEIPELKYVSPVTFELYWYWMYRGKHVEFYHLAATDNEQWNLLAKSYIMAQSLQDLDYKDAIMDAMIRKLRARSYPAVDLVFLLFDGTPTNSLIHPPLVKLFRDRSNAEGGREWMQTATTPIPQDLLMGITLRIDETTSLKNIHACQYHEHGETRGSCYLDKTHP